MAQDFPGKGERVEGSVWSHRLVVVCVDLSGLCQFLSLLSSRERALCLGRVRFNEGAAGSKSARAGWGLGVKCLECQSKQLGSWPVRNARPGSVYREESLAAVQRHIGIGETAAERQVTRMSL